MTVLKAISKGRLRMELDEVAGQAVAVYPAFRKVLGLNAAAAQFLSQAIYWTERKADGWFYKTNAEWLDELGLTAEEVKGARRKLKALGLLAEQRKGIPPKLHYRVDTVRLMALLSGEKPLFDSGKTPELKVVKPAQRTEENPRDNTENTQRLLQTPLNASAAVEQEDARQEQEPAPVQPAIPNARDLVSITLDWQPDRNRLKAYAAKAGVPFDLFTEDAIGLFTVHFEPSGQARTQGQWEASLVKWVNRDRQSAAKAPRRGNQPDLSRHTGFDKRDYTDGLIQREDGTYGL